MLEFGYALREKQLLAQEYIYSDEFTNLVVDWPTGMGKFTAAQMAIDKTIAELARAILISPTKALTSEQRRDLKKMFGKNKVAFITGDFSDIKDFTYEKCSQYDIFIFTYEKLASIMRKPSKKELFFEQLNIGLIVTDEAHMITSKNRGSRLEVMLAAIRHSYPLIHYVYLSATIGDPYRFASWCDAELIHADRSERPIPLEIEVKVHPKIYMPQEKFDYKFSMLQQVLVKYPKNKILIWCSSRERAENIAKILAGINIFTKMHGDELIDALLAKGVCYHDAGLEYEQRERIEKEYNDNKDFRIITCTATLSMGVNLPADIVVMFDTTMFFWKLSEEILLEEYSYHQVIGRAGRPGKSEFGKAIAFAETTFAREVDRILNGTITIQSRVRENIYREALDVFMYYAERVDDLVEIFGTLYDPISADETLEVIKWLLNNKFIQENDDGTISVTFLGKMTSYSMIKPETALKILKVNAEAKMKSFDETQDYIWLFDNLLNNEEFLDGIAVRNNRNDRAALEIAEKIYRFSSQSTAKAFAFIFKKFLRIRGVITAKEEESVRTGHEVKQLSSDALRYITAAEMICYKQKAIYAKLGIMVKTGMLDQEAYKLSMIQGIGVARLEHLFDNKITTVKSFLERDTDDLAKILRVSVDTAENMKEIARVSFS